MAARRQVVLIVLPLALAACGGSSSTPVSGDPLAGAARHTLAQGSEKVTLDGKVELSGQTLKVGGEGAFGRAGGRLRLELTLPVLGKAAVEELVVGRQVWLGSPLLAATLHGKRWLRLAGPTVLGYNLGVLTRVTPTSLLRLLEEDGELTGLGDATVAGVATTRYRLVPRKATGRERVTSAEAWVDGGNLVRRVRIEADAGVGGSGGDTAHTVLTVGYSDFGTPVAVAPPPASEVSG